MTAVFSHAAISAFSAKNDDFTPFTSARNWIDGKWCDPATSRCSRWLRLRAAPAAKSQRGDTAEASRARSLQDELLPESPNSGVNSALTARK